MENYHFTVLGAGGHVLGERDADCVDDFQAEAAARIMLLSRGTVVVEARTNGRLLYSVAR
jgi:hypothetical protein